MIDAGQPPARSTLEAAQRQLNFTAPSAQTLKFLREILGAQTSTHFPPSRGTTKTATKTTTTSTKAAKRAPSSRTAGKEGRSQGRQVNPQLHIHGDGQPTKLSSADCCKLATETFNATLKQLGAAANATRTAKASGAVGPPEPSAARSARVFKEFSPNRKRQHNIAPGKNEGSKPSVTDWEVLVECSSCALRYLRAYEAKGSQKPPGLDNAALVLLDRTITLNLVEQAQRQVHEIRRHHLGLPCSDLPRSGTGNIAACLLASADAPRDVSGVGFITSLQSQVLRLILCLGPAAISPNLLKALDINNPGSPAAFILQAAENGLYTPEQAGDHLHTISQALFKLHSEATRPEYRSSSPNDAFDLFCLAMRIKLESWKHTGHKPNPETDVWSKFQTAARFLLSSDRRGDGTAGSVLQSLDLLRNLLSRGRVDDPVPAELVERLLCFPDMTRTPEMTMLVEKLLDHSSSTTYLIFVCYIAASRLKDDGVDAALVASSADRVTDMLSSTTDLLDLQLERALLHVAQLRKAVVEVAPGIEKHESLRSEVSPAHQLHDSVLRLMFAISSFICGCVQRTREFPSRSTNEAQHAILTTFVKTVDALLIAEQCLGSPSGDLHETGLRALQSCTATLRNVQADSSHSAGETLSQKTGSQLQVRLSNAFWRRYLRSTERKGTLQVQVQLLRLSIEAMSGLSATDHRSAFSGLKHERLAACYSEVGDNARCKAALAQAIQFRVEGGPLDDLVKLAASGSVKRAWSHPDSMGTVLSRNLASFNSACLSQPTVEDDNDVLVYDCPELPTLHRVVLLEKQIYMMYDKGVAERQQKAYAVQVRSLWNLMQEPPHRVYRLRFVNNLLHLGLRHRVSPAAFPLESAQVEEACSEKAPAKSSIVLSRCRTGLGLSATIRHALLVGTSFSPSALEALHQLGDLLQRCKTLDQANLEVDDPADCILPLRLYVDCAGMLRQYREGIYVLETLRHMLQLGCPSSEISVAEVYGLLGKFYAAVQETTLAAQSFSAVAVASQDGSTHRLGIVESALACAEHYLDLGDAEKAAHWLKSAQKSWQDGNAHDQEIREFRLRKQFLICTAAHLTSQLAYRRGHLEAATVWGRQAVRIISAIWISIEKSWDAAGSSTPVPAMAGQVSEDLAQAMSKLDVSSPEFRSVPLHVARYWTQIMRYCSALNHLASLSAHCGLYQDATCYYDQTLKVARRTGQPHIEAIALSEVSLLYARAGHLSKAQQALTQLPDASEWDDALTRVTVRANCGDVSLLEGDISAAQRHLVEASRHIDEVLCGHPLTKKPPSVKRAPSKRPGVKGSEQKARTGPKSLVSEAVTTARPLTNHSDRTRDVLDAMDKITALAARLSLAQGQDDQVVDGGLPSELMSSSNGPAKVIAEALGYFRSALAQFAEDADKSLLAETAVAIPVRYKSARQSGRMSFVQGAALRPRLLGARGAKGPGPGGPSPEKGTAAEGIALLCRAYQALSQMRDLPVHLVPLDMVHDAEKAIAHIRILSTALGQPFVTSARELVLDSLASKDAAGDRERAVCWSEQAATDKDEMERWPSPDLDGRPETLAATRPPYDLSKLPRSWCIVSLELDKSRQELLVGRLTRDRSPFVIRIPLARPDTVDSEQGGLDFESAKAEMHEIIQKANESAHDNRGSSSDKKARKAWYSERQTLDRQLATLLDKVENVWFGGFRGLLVGGGVDDDMLMRFSRDFTATLNRHLPSRHKSAKSSEARVELHAHVMELFVALGHPRRVDLEDSITDLVYFVIDVLQFNGERNAYDEIDFDAMVVEISDALVVYHEERRRRQAAASRGSHMILVLDKELHAFPWESLACLRGQAVSRMPSLGAIWGRLERDPGRVAEHDACGVSRSHGAYILNPSSDLTSTQETFGEILQQQLPHFQAIVGRAPREAEFESMLRDHELVLYFGHGGGAQYIRGRIVRKMKACAVTLLMGCSSAKLTECGVYEPYGMPWHYLNGGSAAVVGTLWDVTDKDIDRFTLQLLEAWGLLEAGPRSSHRDAAQALALAQGGEPPDLRARSGEPARPHGEATSLDEAVVGARDSCLLKFLNGAAPVVYGVPVLLQ